MASRILDTVTTTTVGIKPKNAATKWPEGGALAQVGLSAGTAVVRLRAWNDAAYREEIVEFTLPVPAGQEGAGNLRDVAHIPAPFADFDWNVVSITGGGTLTLTVCGPAL